MKIRAGFVSNSSSSMFVVAFPREPKTAKEVKQILFGNCDTFQNPYDNDSTPTEQIAKTVWEDIKPQRKWKKKYRDSKVYEAIANGWFEGQPDYKDFVIPQPPPVSVVVDGRTILTERRRVETDYKAYEEACTKAATKVVDKMLEKWKNKVLYVFHYGDESGAYFSVLEHGGIFNTLPHKQISYH